MPLIDTDNMNYAQTVEFARVVRATAIWYLSHKEPAPDNFMLASATKTELLLSMANDKLNVLSLTLAHVDLETKLTEKEDFRLKMAEMTESLVTLIQFVSQTPFGAIIREMNLSQRQN